MIDWLRAVIPCTHPEPINGGRVLKITREGEMEWQSECKLSVPGSDDAHIYVRSDPSGPGSLLYIDGNPTKFIQGHNLWGTDDLIGLVYEFMDRLCPMIGATPTHQDRLAWLTGNYELKCIDINYTWHLNSQNDVLAWLRSAEYNAHLRFRGRGTFRGSTLYFAQNSRRSSLKCYSKGVEVNAPGHKLPERLRTPFMLDWAAKSLRIELRSMTLDLKRRGLHKASMWAHNTPSEIHQEMLSGLEMTGSYIIPEDQLPKLPARLQAAYIAWRDGYDLRSMYPRPTFYRYRRELLKFDIDIATLQAKDISNVVPLIRVLEARPVSVPEWALGTDLYFDPPKRAA